MENVWSAVSQLWPFLLIIVVFYFLMIRPENKRKKTIAEMRSALKVGDKVMTLGGIVGEICAIDDDLITIETGEDRVRIQLDRAAISSSGMQALNKK
ncbi:MAG: preprotein translocase subunit YajC [Oscillospiraceae bacterium]|jgi:preprotein translocase subunit YajC